MRGRMGGGGDGGPFIYEASILFLTKEASQRATLFLISGRNEHRGPRTDVKSKGARAADGVQGSVRRLLRRSRTVPGVRGRRGRMKPINQSRN